MWTTVTKKLTELRSKGSFRPYLPKGCRYFQTSFPSALACVQMIQDNKIKGKNQPKVSNSREDLQSKRLISNEKLWLQLWP